MVVEQSRKRTGSATNKLPVFIRLKPSEKQFGLSINDSEILIKKRSFQSKCIFQNCSQEALYNHVGSPMIAASLRGVSSTLLTIGASGTGKNYTLFGGNQLGFDSGLIIRVLENIIFNKEKLDAEVYAYEVCPRDQIMDLIKPSNTGDVTAGGKVIGISIAKITSRQDISYFLSKIIQNTSKGCHKVINIQVTKTDFSAGEIVKSNIVFIQLSPAEGNALISRQHSLLEHVFVAMKSRRDPAKIPFRQSKLTHSLQMALFRRSNISILCTIDPSELHINYTIETLRFSSRISNITITQKSNKPIEDPVLISKKLKKGIWGYIHDGNLFYKNCLK